MVACSEPSSKRCVQARVQAPSKEPQRNAGNRRRERGRGGERVDVVGLRLTRAIPRSDTSAVAAHPLHRIANNGDDAENDASKNPRRVASPSKIRPKKGGRTGPVAGSRARVSRSNEQRVIVALVVDRAEEEIALEAERFRASRGTRSRRISETLRHSSATKRIDAMTVPLRSRTPLPLSSPLPPRSVLLFFFDRGSDQISTRSSIPFSRPPLRPSIPEDDEIVSFRRVRVISGSHRIIRA